MCVFVSEWYYFLIVKFEPIPMEEFSYSFIK